MPVDYLSYNIINAITWKPFKYGNNKTSIPWTGISNDSSYIGNSQLTPITMASSDFTKRMLIEDGLVWYKIKCQSELSWAILFLSKALVPDVLQEIHGNELAQHDGLYNAKEWALQCYYTDIAANLETCHCCQTKKTVS